MGWILVKPGTCLLLVVLAVLFMSGVPAVSADSGVIHTLNPGDSIQQNITHAADGDILVLNPGTYSERGIEVTKNITIRANTSSGGVAANTIIDAALAGRIFNVTGTDSFVVDNLTLENGKVTGENGGAIYAKSSTVTINSSVFSGCLADYGGAIYAEESVVTILSSLFTECDTLNSLGSGVYGYDSTVTLHFCRIHNSTRSYIDADWGLQGTIDATNNWWGTNAEPNVFSDVGFYVSYNPWLVLGIAAEPQYITGGDTNAVRANLTYNSAGTDTLGYGHVPDGVPVTYSVVRGFGSVLPLAGNLSLGVNTTTLTPTAFGSVRVNATLDGQTVSLLIMGTEPVPAVINIEPDIGVNTTTTSVMIKGYSFNATSLPSVNMTQDGYDVVSLAVVSGNATAISATVPEHTPAGTWNITVINPYGTEGTNKSVMFTMLYELPVPEVTGISPSANLNTTPTAVTITGNWFDTATAPTVRVTRDGFDNITLTSVTVTGMTSLSGRVPAYAVAGTWNVTVVNPDGKEGSNASVTFTVIPPPILPVPAFSATPLSGSSPLDVQFTDQSAGSPTGWAWFFGDETYTQPWTLQTANPGWGRFGSMSAVVLPDGSIVTLIPDESSPSDTVWRSTDKGRTWTIQSAKAEWDTHSSHASVAMPDGSIVLMGGTDVGERFNDTWRSTDKGRTWILMNASAGWEKRYCHSSVVLPDGSIVLMGGNTHGTNLNDVWRSSDYGETWTLQTSSAEWSTRSAAAAVALSDGSIVLMGGHSGKNDVWRSTDKGRTWVRINASAGWSKRYGHTGVVMPDDRILLMGGYSSVSGDYMNDTWLSSDKGTTWTRVNASAGWHARYYAVGVVLPDGSVILLGGYESPEDDDVWSFVPTGSAEQNPSHTYTSGGNSTVTLQAYTGEGFNSTRRAGYIQVTGSAPILTGITPAYGVNTSATLVTITGTGFNATVPPVVNLTKTGYANISVTGTNLSSTSFTVTIPSGEPAVVWNVTVINPDGLEGANASVTFEVTQQGTVPVADFTFTPVTGEVALNVAFTDQSTGNPTSWAWDFGDGDSTNATLQNPVHQYTSAGVYTITLAAASANGTGTKTQYGNLTVTTPVNASPVNFEGVIRTDPVNNDYLFNITDIRNAGGTVHNISATLVDYQPAGWHRILVTGAGVSNDTLYIYANSVSRVEMTTLNDTETFAGPGTVGSQFTLEQSVLAQNVSPFGRTWAPGANTSVTSQFQSALQSRGLTLNATAFTVEVTGAGAFNANMTGSNAVYINLSISHAWVTALGGPSAIRIIHLPEAGSPEVLGTTYLGGDGTTDFFSAYASSLSIFGLAGTGSSASSGGSSSSGSSNEPTIISRPGTTAVTVVSLGDVSAGSTVTAHFNQVPASSADPPTVDRVTITTRDTLTNAELTAVPVNQYSSSVFSGKLVSGYLSISLTGVNANDVSNGSITFVVNAAWLDGHNKKPSDVVLMVSNNDGTWTALPTTYTEKIGSGYYFIATITRFGTFAVTTGTGMSSSGTVGQTPTIVPSSILGGTGSSGVRADEASGTSAVPGMTAPKGTSVETAAPPETATVILPPPSGTPLKLSPVILAVAGISVVVVGIVAVALYRKKKRFDPLG